jgi:hypothetical protein
VSNDREGSGGVYYRQVPSELSFPIYVEYPYVLQKERHPSLKVRAGSTIVYSVVLTIILSK